MRLNTGSRTKSEHRRMPFESDRDDILFTIRMGLMHCRTSLELSGAQCGAFVHEDAGGSWPHTP